MTWHFRGYAVIGGQRTACGRYIELGQYLQPAITDDLDMVDCKKCKSTERFRLLAASRSLARKRALAGTR